MLEYVYVRMYIQFFFQATGRAFFLHLSAYIRDDFISRVRAHIALAARLDRNLKVVIETLAHRLCAFHRCTYMSCAEK